MAKILNVLLLNILSVNNPFLNRKPNKASVKVLAMAQIKNGIIPLSMAIDCPITNEDAQAQLNATLTPILISFLRRKTSFYSV